MAPPAANFSLAKLDVRRYDVFAVCSDAFWRRRRPLVQSFFAHLRSANGHGFLVTPSPHICHAVTAEMGITCVAEHHYWHDGALSKERWRVLLYAAQRGHRLMYAGLDLRFLRPVQSVFDAVRTDGAVDAAFEGKFTRHLSRVHDFTPDLVAVFPTSRLVHFLERLVDLLRGRTTDGLPRYMRVPQLLRFNLMGPAEQDLLRDALLSTLYNQTVVTRKYAIAMQAAAAMCKDSSSPCLTPARNPSLPRCPPAGAAAALAAASPLAWACAGAGVLAESALGRLPYQQTEHGAITIRTPLLAIHITDRTVLNPHQWARHCQPPIAAQCSWALQATPPFVAVHCLGKDPSCLELSRCPCWQQHLQRPQRHPAPAR